MQLSSVDVCQCLVADRLRSEGECSRVKYVPSPSARLVPRANFARSGFFFFLYYTVSVSAQFRAVVVWSGRKMSLDFADLVSYKFDCI